MNTTSATKTVESATLTLESVYDIHGSHSLSFGMFRVSHSISDHILQKNLENTTSFFINEARDPLDAPSSRQAPDGRLGDALDVITKNFPVSLGASLSKSLASFATSRHVRISK